MSRRWSCCTLALLLLLAGTAAGEPALVTAVGRVVKANADVVLVRPLGANGRLGKAVALKVQGTSRVTIAATQTRNGRPVAVQRDTEPKGLRPDQAIGVIYAVTAEELVLVSAVAAPPEGR